MAFYPREEKILAFTNYHNDVFIWRANRCYSRKRGRAFHLHGVLSLT